jgi:hypothetical protein
MPEQEVGMKSGYMVMAAHRPPPGSFSTAVENFMILLHISSRGIQNLRDIRFYKERFEKSCRSYHQRTLIRIL